MACVKLHLATDFTPDIQRRIAADKNDYECNLVDAYQYLLDKMELDAVRKVVITFSNIARPAELVLNVLIIYVPVDETIFSVASEERPQYWLRIVHKNLCELAKVRGWSIETFQKAFTQLESQDYSLSGTIVKAKFSPNRQRRAQVLWTFNAQGGRVDVEVSDAKRKIESKITLPKHYYHVSTMIDDVAKLEWIDASRIRLMENEKDYWEIDVISSVVDFRNTKADEGDAHAEYALGRCYLEGRVGGDREKALFWIRKSAAQNYKHAVKLLESLAKDDKH